MDRDLFQPIRLNDLIWEKLQDSLTEDERQQFNVWKESLFNNVTSVRREMQQSCGDATVAMLSMRSLAAQIGHIPHFDSKCE